MDLKSALKTMVSSALRHPGRVQTATLSRGLVVRLYVSNDMQDIHLSIQRPEVYPSESEWMTILRKWPVPLPQTWPKPEYKSSPNVKALCACWQTPQLEF
jgi:hypothetical protein